MLSGIYPGVSVADIKGRTGWDLRVSADLGEIPAPSEPELTALRGLLATMPAGKASRVPPAAAPAAPVTTPATEGAAR